MTDSAIVTERLRVAGVNAEGVVVDYFAVDVSEEKPFTAWAIECAETIGARWPGGVFVLASHEPDVHVEIGWRRENDTWLPPKTTREQAIVSINAATAGRIASGFEFRGKRFSLSENSQITILGTYNARASLAYGNDGIPWATIDDSDFVMLKNAADVEEFYTAMTTTIIAARTEGNLRKQALDL